MSVVYSMTGFASVQASLRGEVSFGLTIKGVNHRFLDLNLRLPSQCDALEMQVRKLLKERLRRGHVELTLQIARRASGEMQLNRELLGGYVAGYREAAGLYGVVAEPDLNALLRMPGVMTAESGWSGAEMEGFDAAVVAELEALLGEFDRVRAEEGASLVAELRASMLRLRGFAAEVVELRVGVREAQVERLRARMAELLQGTAVSEERLLTEAALLAERSDIDEEIVRLQTHVERFLTMLDDGGELGKRLDFLLQELNREANTMLSKTGSATGSGGLRITELGLEMKAEIEKAREQVQNLE